MLHLTVDTPGEEKAAAALKQAGAAQAEKLAKGNADATKARLEAAEERRRRREEGEAHERAMEAMGASIDRAVREGIEAATTELMNLHEKERDELAERCRMLELAAAEADAKLATKMVEVQEQVRVLANPNPGRPPKPAARRC